MSSVASLLTGTPARLASDLLPEAVSTQNLTIKNAAGEVTVAAFTLPTPTTGARGAIDIFAVDNEVDDNQIAYMRLRGYDGGDVDICRADLPGGPVPFINSDGATKDTTIGYNFAPFAKVNVVGAEGAGRIYDTKNFPVMPLGVTSEETVLSGDPGGATISTPYTAPWAGYYTVGHSLQCGSGAAWSAGQFAAFVTYVEHNGVNAIYPNGRSLWTTPWSTADNEITDDRWHPVFLEEGDIVTCVDKSNAALNMGAGGSFACVIQPLVRIDE